VTATINVGPLSPQHRSRIEAIVRATGVFNEDEIGVALEVFDKTSEYECLGAFDGDSLVGYVCFGATPSTDRTYDLYWIAVHPEAQRFGVGATLMSEVEQRLWQRRARLVVVETSSRDDYAPTRRFYHKRGYQETARLRDFYAPGDDRVVLTKRVGLHQPPLYE
jgi:ribosomal protein S18 acetylase RimI-like enzyme